MKKRRKLKRQAVAVLTLNDVIQAQRVADQAQSDAHNIRRAFETHVSTMQSAIETLKPKRRKKRAAWGSKKKTLAARRANLDPIRGPRVKLVRNPRRKAKARTKADRPRDTSKVKVAAPKRSHSKKAKLSAKQPATVDAFKG